MQHTCYFCGAILPKAHNNNAEDFKLHRETYGKSCCTRCNELITTTNRAFSEYIKEGRKEKIDQLIEVLMEFRKKLDDIDYVEEMEKLGIPLMGIGEDYFEMVYCAKADNTN